MPKIVRPNFKLTPPMPVSNNREILDISVERNGKKSKVKTKVICKFCGKLFSRTDNLDTHEKVQHLEEGEEFNCEICHVGFFVHSIQKYAQIANYSKFNKKISDFCIKNFTFELSFLSRLSLKIFFPQTRQQILFQIKPIFINM